MDEVERADEREDRDEPQADQDIAQEKTHHTTEIIIEGRVDIGRKCCTRRDVERLPAQHPPHVIGNAAIDPFALERIAQADRYQYQKEPDVACREQAQQSLETTVSG